MGWMLRLLLLPNDSRRRSVHSIRHLVQATSIAEVVIVTVPTPKWSRHCTAVGALPSFQQGWVICVNNYQDRKEREKSYMVSSFGLEHTHKRTDGIHYGLALNHSGQHHPFAPAARQALQRAVAADSF